MTRQVRLVFPGSGVRVLASLLDADAPLTCEHVWRLLDRPLQATVDSGPRGSGEIVFPVASAPKVPPENASPVTSLGDLVLLRGTSCRIAVAYGPRGAADQSNPGNLFAVVTGDREQLQKVARDVEEKGPQEMRIERVPASPLPFLKEGVIQVGQVVKDLDRAVEGYWHLFGIGPWRIYTYHKPVLKLLDYHGRPVDSKFRIALTWIGPLCLELIEHMSGETVYADFIRDHGYGVHHLAVVVKDMQAALAQVKAAGVGVDQEGGGQGADGTGHFAYLDTEERIGTTLELVEWPKLRVAPDRVYPPEE